MELLKELRREPVKGGSILIINDNADQLELLRLELARAGFTCIKASDGEAGWRQAYRHRPDLIISDVSMPVMDGLTLCRQIRADAELADTPLLLVSALHRDTESVIEGIRLGADDYLEVPYDPLLLIAKASRLIERRRLEEGLRQSQQFLSLLLDNAPAPVFIQDCAHRVQLVNKQWEHAIGVTRQEALGKTIFELFPAAVAAKFAAHDQKIFASQTPQVFDEEVGGRCYYTVKFPLFSRTQEVEAVCGISLDITDRQQAERAVRESEQLLRTILEALPVGVWTTDRHGNILTGNRAGLAIWAGAKYVGINQYGEYKGWWAETGRRIEAHEWAMARAITQGETSLNEVVEIECFDGTRKTILNSAVPIRDDKQEITGAIVVNQDITERQQAERALRRSEERFRLVSRATNDLIYDWDLKTGEVFWNEALFASFGYAPAEVEEHDRWWMGAIHPDDRQRIKVSLDAALQTPAPTWSEEYRFRRGDGSYALVLDRGILARDERGTAVRMIGTMMDLTERRQTEEALLEKDEQLRQAQKMEAIGRLAGGVAHDFNNLLTAINGYADLSLRQLRDDDPLQRNLAEIKKAGLRAADLTRQLLAFSRKQILQPKVINLNAAISDLTRLLQRIIGEDIDLQLRLAAALAPVKADPGQLEQIIINLAVNSRDAMPEGGALLIETANVQLDDAFASAHVGVKPGDYCMLAVSDTGCGMDEATMQRIFEPFFTTKEVGKGTGLGLATVYGIVQQSGGSIWVESRLAEGTTFTIYLPKVNEPFEPPIAEKSAALRRGAETILLVEDDELVRAVALVTLRQGGYHVLEATHGGEALLVAEEYAGEIHLVLTDMVMPRMNGRVLVEHLQKRRPQIKALYMSGYTEDAVFRRTATEERIHFIEKPMTPEALCRKVREVLDAL